VFCNGIAYKLDRTFQSLEYLNSKGITHIFNLGELDPLGVAPKIDPESLPGKSFGDLKNAFHFLLQVDLLVCRYP
jgi:hypothetical protein